MRRDAALDLILGVCFVAILCEGHVLTRRNTTVDDAKLALFVQDFSCMASQRLYPMSSLLGSKKAHDRAFRKKNTWYHAVRWHRRLYGRDVADVDMLNTVFLLTKSLLEFHTDQAVSLASWNLFSGVPTLNHTLESWIPKSRRGIQADAPCPVFDEQGHRGAEIGVDAKYGKNASWSELTGYQSRVCLTTLSTNGLRLLNFTEVAFHQDDTLFFLRESVKVFRSTLSLTPSSTYDVQLLVEGPCLVPFTAGRQVAVDVVLAQMLGEVTNAFGVRLQRVDQAVVMTGSEDAVLLHMSVAKFEEVHLPSLDEAFNSAAHGILSTVEGQSRFSQEMLTHGLVISSARAIHVALSTRGTPVTHTEWLKHWREQARREQETHNAIYGSLGVAILLVAGSGLWQWWLFRRKHPQSAFLDNSVRHFCQALSAGSRQNGSAGSPKSSMRDLTDTWGEGCLRREDLTIVRDADGGPVILGKGGSAGMVLKGLMHGVVEVAVKVFPNTIELRALFLKEVQLLKRCLNPYIVQFQGCMFLGGEIGLVMEYCAGGNLFNALEVDKGWMWAERGEGVALDVARGMHFLHLHGVIHLDLKSPNILLTKDGTAKIADVGMAQLLRGSKSHASNLAQGTFDWIAPEVLMHGQAGLSADVFSYGVVLWELVTGQVPKRTQMRKLRVPEECSAEVAQLVQDCLQVTPSLRPTVEEIISRLQDMEIMSRASSANSSDPDPEIVAAFMQPTQFVAAAVGKLNYALKRRGQ